MGSGKVIRSAITKYGVDNFTKEILETFDTQEEMFQREKEVVTEEFLAREDVYNLRRGGDGGFDYINKNLSSGDRSAYGTIGGSKNSELQKLHRIEWAKLGQLAAKEKKNGGIYDREVGNFGREIAKSALAILKRKESFKQIKHQQGSNNNQFGTCWIWHELIGSKKCKKELLPLYIDQGWFKGRNLNY